MQVSLIFSLQPITFATEQARVAYIITLLTGRALSWATSEWEKQSPFCADAVSFSQALRKVFDSSRTSSGQEAGRRLLDCHQGARSVATYAIEFRTLANEASWEEKVLAVLFARGLSEVIKDELALRDIPNQLDAVIELAVRLDGRRLERNRERGLARGFTHATAAASEGTRRSREEGKEQEAMELGATDLLAGERRRRLEERRCFQCGRLGHQVASCFQRKGNGNTR